MLSKLQLDEPIVTAVVAYLEANLPAVITSYNATVTDGYMVPTVAQFLPVMPYEGLFPAGLPIVGVTGMGAEFEDDLVFDVDAEHRFAIISVIQSSDFVTLAWQLRRLTQCVANAIQTDRVLGPANSQIQQGSGLWNVRFVRSEPGPILGDIDPTSPGAPPRAWISWSGLLFDGKRKEVNAGG